MEINQRFEIPDDELTWSFARSGGPGGQNVNKVASKAVLRWNVERNTTIPADVRARLRARHHRRITVEGDLVLSSERYRDQARNVCAARHQPTRQIGLKARHGVNRRNEAEEWAENRRILGEATACANAQSADYDSC